MKANKNQLRLEVSGLEDPSESIQNVLQPFKTQVKQMKLNVYVATRLRNAKLII
jgi:hypothetical protein